MNGRVYDPVIGRFLSPDPLVQSPENLQNFNRYSYVLNNPLSYIDPSGLSFFKILKKIVTIAIAAAISYYMPGALTGLFSFSSPALATLGNIVAGAVTGFSVSASTVLLNGGNLSQAVRAGIRAAPFSAARVLSATFVGDFLAKGPVQRFFGANLEDVRAVAHAVSGGAISAASGESFRSGFLSGLVSNFTILKTQGSPVELQKVASILAGGVSSAISGGKFADGAMSGAFIYLYNHAASHNDPFRSGLDRYADRYNIRDQEMLFEPYGPGPSYGPFGPGEEEMHNALEISSLTAGVGALAVGAFCVFGGEVVCAAGIIRTFAISALRGVAVGTAIGAAAMNPNPELAVSGVYREAFWGAATFASPEKVGLAIESIHVGKDAVHLMSEEKQ